MYNKIVVVGRLGQDPELKTTSSGKTMCSFSLATKEKYGTPPVENTQWHNIVVWGKSSDACSKYLKKGSLALVEGKIQTRTWEKDGKKNYKTEVVANEIKFLDPAKDKGQGQTEIPQMSDDDLMNIPF